MANPENFQIRIKKDGTIYMKTGPLSEERLRQLKEMLEDCLGSVTLTAKDDDIPGSVVIIPDQTKHIETRTK